ncbi:MAG TPA: protein kinase [Gemmatimonadaceae bacterium]|nr:protein kinase [Gemmatimonadaceae bacterium]
MFEEGQLVGHYKVVSLLGEGGMGQVYLAEDPKHGRRVALKVLRPELADSLGPGRFLREIAVAARLQHPHILPLFDSGEAGGGVLYFAMPFVEGESLRVLLVRQRQLPVETAVRIAREVALALDYAHRQGVVHRDIKPENILLHEGQAIVADFGIARALGAAGGGALTGTGMVIGTPGYMSPEQASGDPSVDERSDIYSLGSVLYEMLAGEPPYPGASPQVVIAKQFTDPVPSIRRLRETVPEHVATAVTRALAKVPADRFATAGEFANALGATVGQGSDASATDRSSPGNPELSQPLRAAGPVWGRRRRFAVIAAGTSALAFLVTVGSWIAAHRTSAVDADGRRAIARAPRQPNDATAAKSIAVLPFVNVGGDTANEYFAEGMTDELTGALARIPGLQVMSRTSAFAFKGRQGVDVREIGRTLNVSSLLEGSVRRAGDQLRVRVQLTSSNNGLTLWSDSYQRGVEDVFAVQNDIATATARALRLTLNPGANGDVVNPSTTSLAAHDLYLRARYLARKFTEPDSRKSIALFEQAIADDSAYALAWAGMAEAWGNAADFFLSPRDAYPRAKTAALRAITLDPKLAEAHTQLAGILMGYDWNLPAAGDAIARALSINPSSSDALNMHGLILMESGQLDSAITVLRKSRSLDPLSSYPAFWLVWLHCTTGHADLGLAVAREALAVNADDPLMQDALSIALLATGDATAAREAAVEAGPLGPAAQLAVLRSEVVRGHPEEARRTLRALEAEAARHYVDPVMIAMGYAALSDRDATIDWLEKGYTERSANMMTLQVLREWDSVRADPRFASIVQRVKTRHTLTPH